MKLRALLLVAISLFSGAALTGCCCDLFCEIPKCDPCAPKCNPCDRCSPCAAPCASPCAPPAVVVAPAPAAPAPSTYAAPK
jgi:hypothetical protein